MVASSCDPRLGSRRSSVRSVKFIILSSRFDVDGASAIVLGLHDMWRDQMIGPWSARSILRQDGVFSQSHFLYQSQYHFPRRKSKSGGIPRLGEVLGGTVRQRQ